VILWPDTFNDHFTPEIAASALEVLEAAGHAVDVPDGFLCCGRPLYDFGMLDLAKGRLLRILDRLRPEIREGIPIVGLEPSCISVFRDELPNLLVNDPDALRLSRQAFTLDEFLMREGSGYVPPRLQAEALVHGHCHQKAVMDAGAQGRLLTAIGLDWKAPESGCCGMAGSFGFEKGKYGISSAIAERHLMPAVRSAGKDTLVLADGFSCREQILSADGAEPLHVSQVLHMALRGKGAVASMRREIRNPWTWRRKGLLLVLLSAASAAAAFFAGRKGSGSRGIQ
jgi:Fe-S oxidoreductase